MQRTYLANSRNQYAPVTPLILSVLTLHASGKIRLDSGGTKRNLGGALKISRKSEYAIRALVAMTQHRRSWNIQELAAQEAISVKFLEQILLALRHAGFLSAKRGVGGGYTLRVNPADLRLGDVIRAMEGPIAPVSCTAGLPAEECTCRDQRNCPLRLVMVEVRDAINAILDHRTIEDLARTASGNELAFEI